MPINTGLGGLNGVRITVSEHALEETDQRLFPESKNRSKRIHKKLVKRFGGEFRKVPCMWKTPHGIVAHPVLYAKLQAEIVQRQNYSGNPW